MLYVLDYGSECTLVQIFCIVIFSGTNWSVDILRLEDFLLQVFFSSGEDFRGWSYSKDVL